jgi:hypothetical protein
MDASFIHRPLSFGALAPNFYALLLVICLFMLFWQTASHGTQSEIAQPLRGKVVFSDGSAASAAKVEATAKCDGLGLVQFTTTAEDGSFSFPLFHRKEYRDVDCKKYEFRASKEEDYWLPSDEHIFSGLSPAVPTANIPVGVDSPSIQIVLGVRGGKVSIRVWDIATNRFVRAMVYLERKPVVGMKFGSEQWETNENGSPASELLPPGEYTVEVQSYPCRAEEYWTVGGPTDSFTVEPGKQQDEIIRIDVRDIKPLSGPSFRRRRKCKP